MDSVKQYLFYRDAVLTFKCMSGTVPEYLSQQFVWRGSISGRCTRNSQSLNIPLYKSATGQITAPFLSGMPFQRILNRAHRYKLLNVNFENIF